jgi:hypothetical protein
VTDEPCQIHLPAKGVEKEVSGGMVTLRATAKSAKSSQSQDNGPTRTRFLQLQTEEGEEVVSAGGSILEMLIGPIFEINLKMNVDVTDADVIPAGRILDNVNLDDVDIDDISETAADVGLFAASMVIDEIMGHEFRVETTIESGFKTSLINPSIEENVRHYNFEMNYGGMDVLIADLEFADSSNSLRLDVEMIVFDKQMVDLHHYGEVSGTVLLVEMGDESMQVPVDVDKMERLAEGAFIIFEFAGRTVDILIGRNDAHRLGGDCWAHSSTEYIKSNLTLCEISDSSWSAEFKSTKVRTGGRGYCTVPYTMLCSRILRIIYSFCYIHIHMHAYIHTCIYRLSGVVGRCVAPLLCFVHY